MSGVEAVLESHWLVFNEARQVVGCHCGFEADMDSDCGWGDSVVQHLAEVTADHFREWLGSEAVRHEVITETERHSPSIAWECCADRCICANEGDWNAAHLGSAALRVLIGLLGNGGEGKR